MRKYRITHYKKTNSFLFTNGGILIVTDNEYIVKYLFWTVAKFDADKTAASKIPSIANHRGIRLADGVNSIDLYFFAKTAEELYNVFNIK